MLEYTELIQIIDTLYKGKIEVDDYFKLVSTFCNSGQKNSVRLCKLCKYNFLQSSMTDIFPHSLIICAFDLCTKQRILSLCCLLSFLMMSSEAIENISERWDFL
jgi:hypothetical protein